MRRFGAGILMMFSIVLFTISFYSLMGMFLQEKKDDALQEQLREIYEEESDEAGRLPENKKIPGGGSAFPVVDAGLLALHEDNPDCIGWLTIEGTMIDYPVMYHPEEENY